MNSEAGHLGPELQAILDDVAKMRNVRVTRSQPIGLLNFSSQQCTKLLSYFRTMHVALKAYCETQEEMLSLEKEQSAKTKENLDKVTKACLAIERRHKLVTDEVQREKEELRKTVAELQQQCEHLRVVHIDQNANQERIFELQDEVELLKSQLVIQEEKYNEDIAVLKTEHSDEIKKYKMLLGTAKQKQPVRRNTKKENEYKKVNHPAITNSPPAKRKSTQSFRWPSLDIDVISHASESGGEEETSNEKKKRKLFHENTDAAIDIL